MYHYDKAVGHIWETSVDHLCAIIPCGRWARIKRQRAHLRMSAGLLGLLVWQRVGLVAARFWQTTVGHPSAIIPCGTKMYKGPHSVES